MTSLVTSIVRPAGLAFALVATALPASAQIWTYEPDVPRAGVYEPRPYYEPRAYEAPAYAPVVSAPPPALTPAQRTTIYRHRIGRAGAGGARAYRACGFRVRLRSRLSRRGRFCARPHAAGGCLHCSGRAVLPVYGDQQSPAAGRSDDGHRRCRGERLAHARHETKVWVWRLSRRTTAAAAQEK
jgi:hypothetical protein